MKHKKKMKKLERRIKAYNEGPGGKDQHRWVTEKARGGVHKPGSVNK